MSTRSLPLHWFIRHTFIEYLLCVRHSAGSQETVVNKKERSPFAHASPPTLTYQLRYWQLHLRRQDASGLKTKDIYFLTQQKAWRRSDYRIM